MDRSFYVYALFDQNGVVRYIGKGKNGRWTQHQSAKSNRLPFIDGTLAALGEVPRVKIHQNLTEFDAYRFEQTLILAIGMQPDGPLFNKTSKGSGPNSNQVKAWHSRLSKEERRQHMRAATEASQKSPRREEIARRTIRLALAALTPEHHLAAARRLNASYTSEKRSGAMKLRSANMTADERSLIAQKIHSHMTDEQRSEIGRKRNEYITPEIRSEIGRKRSSHLTPEQRAENVRRIIGSQSKEQLSANGKKGKAALTPDQRSGQARKRAQNLGPEKLREIALKGAATRHRKREERSRPSAT